jgi:hypothetical protein
MALKGWQRLERARALEIARSAIPPAQPTAAQTWSAAPGVQIERKTEEVVAGARVCKGRSCAHILPGEAEYSSPMCGVCQGRERRKTEGMAEGPYTEQDLPLVRAFMVI